jgi:tetratricopeptide (TPR) repeat protein
MTIGKRTSAKFAIAIASCVLASGSVFAQDNEREERDKQETKQAQAVSKEIYDRIQKAQELVDAKEYDGALRILNALKNKDNLTDYERQNVLNYVGFVHYNMDNIEAAMQTYEEMLRIPTMEDQIRKGTIYTLAQLNTMQENYTRAIELIEQYFVLETNPAPDPYILYAQNLYQVNRFADMIKPIETAMEIARNREKEVKEDWYVLLNFAYFQQEDYAQVRDIQKTLLMTWPKKRYWFSLAGAYTELGEDNNLIYAYDAAHVQGMLEKESELVTMAQLYMQAEVPYKAASLLDTEMKGGRVTGAAKNYRLLSQAWTLSQEDEKAIPALQEAAKQTEDGELDVRLGNAYLNLGQYGECVSAVQTGLRKGGLKNPDNAQISLGMCLYNQKRYSDSIKSFREAGKARRSQRIANQWIRVIESDIERNKQISMAEAAAKKQADALAERRKRSGRI